MAGINKINSCSFCRCFVLNCFKIKRISTVFMDTYAVFILLDIVASYVIMNTPYAKPMHGK